MTRLAESALAAWVAQERDKNMTANDAINTLRKLQEPGGHVIEHNDYESALHLGIVALIKQIPIKPIEFETDIVGTVYTCPKCGLFLDKPEEIPSWLHNTLYCERCGQAIDWSGLV